MKVEFYRHSLVDTELDSIHSTLQSAFLTTGPKTTEFEQKFSAFLGAPHCIGLTSCTAGLFLTLKALGIQSGDEVIVPAMTFIASANVVLHCGAIPILVDVESDTGLIDLQQMERAITSKTRAVIPVHLYGQMVDMSALQSRLNGRDLIVLEDAAHAIEATHNGIRPGALSDGAAFSFYATKNITSGEGGALVTRRADLNEKVRLMRQHGMSKSAAERYTGTYQHWDMLELGYKYNMFDIQATLLLPQLQAIEKNLQRREQICGYYEREFSQAGIEFPIVKPGVRSARHMFTIWARPGRRDQLLKTLQEQEIGVAVNYRAIHLLTYYQKNFGYLPGMLPHAEQIGDRTLTIPLYPRLTDAEVEYVARSVIESY